MPGWDTCCRPHDRLDCTAGRLVDRQEREGERHPCAARVDEDAYTQMDDQQHAASSAPLGYAAGSAPPARLPRRRESCRARRDARGAR